MSQSKKLQLCRSVVEELCSYGVPADRLIPLMDNTHALLRMGDGLVWSQIAAIIDDVYVGDQ